MNFDAIIFDKDGTLIDFDAFWVKVTEKTMQIVLERFGITNGAVCYCILFALLSDDFKTRRIKGYGSEYNLHSVVYSFYGNYYKGLYRVKSSHTDLRCGCCNMRHSCRYGF